MNATTAALDFTKAGGLLPAIIQDDASGEVLMLGYMNQAALDATMLTSIVTFYSRSRQTLWIKGEKSGHHLLLRSVLFDCDADALLLRVTPQGPGVCHEGYRSCFFRKLSQTGEALIIAQRAFDPAKVYRSGESQ